MRSHYLSYLFPEIVASVVNVPDVMPGESGYHCCVPAMDLRAQGFTRRVACIGFRHEDSLCQLWTLELALGLISQEQLRRIVMHLH